MGSLGGLRPWATHAHYCSSKAAVHMLTKVMAKALAPEIAVNAVAPGMIDLGEKSAAAFMKKMAKQTPMQRNGTAADIAAAVMFFATAPQFITGQVLVVDGGWASRPGKARSSGNMVAHVVVTPNVRTTTVRIRASLQRCRQAVRNQLPLYGAEGYFRSRSAICVAASVRVSFILNLDDTYDTVHERHGVSLPNNHFNAISDHVSGSSPNPRSGSSRGRRP